MKNSYQRVRRSNSAPAEESTRGLLGFIEALRCRSEACKLAADPFFSTPAKRCPKVKQRLFITPNSRVCDTYIYIYLGRYWGGAPPCGSPRPTGTRSRLSPGSLLVKWETVKLSFSNLLSIWLVRRFCCLLLLARAAWRNAQRRAKQWY